MNALKGKTVWVTGASSGIGKALACDAKGARVVLSSNEPEALRQVAAACRNSPLVAAFDLTDTAAIPRVVEEVLGEVGFVEVLFNNGGISQRSEARRTALEVDRKIMEVNFFGNIALTKALLPHWRATGKGAVVVTSSLLGHFGFYLRSAYSASKFALRGFYESLRLEEAQHNVRVHLVFPGYIHTDISIKALDGTGKPHGVMDEGQKNGIPVEKCAKIILRGVERNKRNKRNIYAGGREMLALKLHRHLPPLFRRIMKNRDPRPDST